MYPIKNKTFIYVTIVVTFLVIILVSFLQFIQNKKKQEDGYVMYQVEKYLEQKDFKSAEQYVKANEEKWHGKGKQAALLCLQKYVINAKNNKAFALQNLISCSKESNGSAELKNFIFYTISKAYLAEGNLNLSEKYAKQISKSSAFYVHGMENIAIISIENQNFSKAFKLLTEITKNDGASPKMKERAEKLKYYVVGYL